MKKTIFRVIISLLLASFCLSVYLLVRRFLRFSFRSTNDTLHKRESAFNLDFLIPSGTYLDEKITIGEVPKLCISQEKPFYNRSLRAFFDLIPLGYRYLADLFLFLFWLLCFMTLTRVFTFMGYGRALRESSLLGGLSYYFISDFSLGRSDDIAFIGLPLFLILLGMYILRLKEKREAWKQNG